MIGFDLGSNKFIKISRHEYYRVCLQRLGKYERE